MNEHIDNEHDESATAGDPKLRPQVIYIERPRGMFAAARRVGENVRAKGREWVSDAVDAPLPQGIEGRVPAAWDTRRGRVLVGVGAVLVLALWALVVIWMLG